MIALTQPLGRTAQAAETPPDRLWLSRLSVSAFRNYARATLELDARPVVLTGPNGAGKTNLLEAVSFLAPGRGLRGARLGEVERRDPAGTELEGAPGWAVAARVVTPHGPHDIGTGRDPEAEGAARERRALRIDGAPARGQQSLSELVALVWLTPQMDGLFREAAAARRRFLDRLVFGFDPAHAGRVRAYEHALRERARLLKGETPDPAWLAALEDSLAGRGVAIAAARRALVERLAAARDAGTTAFPQPELGLEGEVEGWLAEEPALAVEERLRERLATARARDAEAGGASVGPHRSDLLVAHRDRGLPAALCSTGEQKALLIGLVLAHARLLTAARGQAPLLLLDELVAHLDDRRRRALFETVLELSAQAWMTGTDAAVFGELRGAAQFRAVESGRVLSAER